MGERIKELRKALGLNQTDFGNRIGLKQGSVAGYENGARTPLDAVITSICREFNVNEVWLRTGEGDMFNEDDAGVDLVTRAMMGQSENKKRLLRIIADMPDELLDKMMEYLESKKKMTAFRRSADHSPRFSFSSWRSVLETISRW